MPKPTKKPNAKINSPRARAARSRLPTKAVASMDGKLSVEKISKQARVIDMLHSPDGMPIASMMKLTGWQQQSVRGFLAGVVKRKLGLKLSSETKDGVRLYRILDEKTGNTEVISSKSVKELSGEEALFKFFAMNYIRSWENYSVVQNFDEQKSLLEYNIEFLRLMSAPQIFSQYRNYISPENPQSPINLFSDKAQRQVFFRSFIVKTNLDNDGLATIQANVDVLESGFNNYNSYSMVIEMTGGFNPDYANSLSEKERRLNPLGFRVISYRSERITR